MTNIQRAIDKQAKLEAEATAGPWEYATAENMSVHWWVKNTVAPMSLEPTKPWICERQNWHMDDGKHGDGKLIAHLRNQAKLARAVIEAANRLTDHPSLGYGMTQDEVDITDALIAWADHVLAEGNGESENP